MRFRPIKIILLAVLALGAGVVALIWSSQWWLPALAPSLLSAADVRVEASRRLDDGRWRLEGLGFARADAPEVAVEFAELPNLWSYCRALWDDRDWQKLQAVAIGATVVRLNEPVESADTEPGGLDWVDAFSRTNDTLATVRKWLPPLEVEQVRLEGPDGEALGEISGLRFDGRALEAELKVAAYKSPLLVNMELKAENWQLQARTSTPQLALDLVVRQAGAELVIEGQITQAEERLDLTAILKGTEALPLEAVVSTSGFSIPDDWIPAIVASELGDIRIEKADIKWAEGAYVGELRLDARMEFEGERTPVTTSVRLEGDLEMLRLENLDFQSAWLEASLRAPLAVGIRDWTVADPAEFRFASDLSKQPFFAAGGKLRGAFTFEPPGNVTFELTGDEIRHADYAVENLVLEGKGDQSGFDIESMSFDFPKETPGTVELDGRYNFEKRYFDFNYKATLGAKFLSTYAGIAWFEGGATAAGKVEGTPDEPLVSGTLEAGIVDLPAVRPVALVAEFSLKGLDSGEFDLTLKRESERIHLAMGVSLSDDERINGVLQAFEWVSGSGELLQLTAPASFRLPLRGGAFVWFDETGVDRVAINGGGRDASLRKEVHGALEFSAGSLSPSLLNGWLEEPLPDLMIREAEVKISSLTPELEGTVSLIVEEKREGLGLVRAELADLEFGRRLKIGGLELSLDGSNLLRVQGELPFGVAWPESEAAPRFNVGEEDAIRVRARTGAPGPLSAIIEQWTGLVVESPEVEVELDGTLQGPQGSVRLRASSMNFDGLKFGLDLSQPLPEIGDIDVELWAKGDRLQIKRMRALIRGGSVAASGDWPLPDGFWHGGIGKRDWRERFEFGRFELSFADWELENWTPYLPDMLRRSGRLNGSVRHEPDAGLSGSVRFENLGLRPSQSFPAVDSIRGEFRVENRALTLADATARVGGSPVSVTGELIWPEWPRMDWAVEVSGKNVPIVRRPDIILRSDLDVRLRSVAATSSAELSGRLGLRSSTMLVEFDPLSPPVRSGPSARPPFFAVKEAPFNSWALDLRIEGERFLRVRSPYFQSLISAGFDLSGTLGEPLLLGGLRIDEGHLSFPGAKLRLDSGEAFIEAAEPNTLRLDVSGTARTGAHVITMQVHGSAEEPQIQFEASPPLPNTSIVRLLSTGSTTGGGAGAVGLYLGRGLLGAGGTNDGLGDRLTIDFGEETTRSGRNTVGIQYDLEKDLSLQGEYDVYDSYNTDLLWTIFEK